MNERPRVKLSDVMQTRVAQFIAEQTAPARVREYAGRVELFLADYEAFARTGHGFGDSRWYAETLALARPSLQRAQLGVERLSRSDPSGYRELRSSCEIVNLFYGRRFDYGYSLEEVGFDADGDHQPPFAEFARALAYAEQLGAILGHELSPTHPLHERLEASVPADPGWHGMIEPRDVGEHVYSGDGVPATGIWAPAENGYPRFFGQGQVLPRDPPRKASERAGHGHVVEWRPLRLERRWTS